MAQVAGHKADVIHLAVTQGWPPNNHASAANAHPAEHATLSRELLSRVVDDAPSTRAGYYPPGTVKPVMN